MLKNEIYHRNIRGNDTTYESMMGKQILNMCFRALSRFVSMNGGFSTWKGSRLTAGAILDQGRESWILVKISYIWCLLKMEDENILFNYDMNMLCLGKWLFCRNMDTCKFESQNFNSWDQWRHLTSWFSPISFFAYHILVH